MRSAPDDKSSWLPRWARQWFDSHHGYADSAPSDADRIDWFRSLPFLALHVSCAAVLWVGVSGVAVMVAVSLYLLRMFAITGFYHRYFSHRSFRTSRGLQFAMACVGASTAQRSPLWWAAHHRHHHQHSDLPSDPHSPRQHGLLWSHTGWFLTRANFLTRTDLVRDWVRYPELVWLDRFDWVPPLVLALTTLALGHCLHVWRPDLGTSGMQMLVWGFGVSTVVLYHATYTINSLGHRLGSRPFPTRDDSRNNALLALITLGEGWHNNHHHCPTAARQGWRWWQFDITFGILALLARLQIVWGLRPAPADSAAMSNSTRRRG